MISIGAQDLLGIGFFNIYDFKVTTTTTAYRRFIDIRSFDLDEIGSPLTLKSHIVRGVTDVS